MKKRLQIGVDVDDVLANQVENIVNHSNLLWNTNLQAADYTEDWSAMWGTTFEETDARARMIHTREIMGEYSYLKDSQEILGKLAKDHTLVVVTARRTSASDITKEWLEKHYPGVFSEIHLAGLWDTIDETSHTLTKAELCVRLKLDYLIDDQLKHCLSTAERGIPAIIFGDYHWNKLDELPSNVIRCRNWQEIGEYFGSI